MRAAGKGLAQFYCKRHIAHRARHGSLWHGTYRASERDPYERAAAAWIGEHRSEPLTAVALTGLNDLLRSTGSVVPATSLRGLTPAKRARVALARLREAGVTPVRLLAIYLGISALIEEDPGSHRVREFRTVQVAKAVHRLASGYHQSWDFPLSDGRTAPIEVHAYARSTGRVLRHLGRMIEECCEPVLERHLADVLALKVERFGKHSAVSQSIGARSSASRE
jgi:hypothetical protein